MRHIFSLGLVATLGACGSPFDETASALQPGQWEERSTETRVIAGDPGLPVKVTRCIPAQEAQRASAFMPEWAQSNCNVSEFVIAKGRVRGAAKCDRPDGAVTTSFEGRFSETAYEIKSRVESNLSGKRRIVVETRTARHLGECPEGEEQVVKITV